jgi:hypothetical protein
MMLEVEESCRAMNSATSRAATVGCLHIQQAMDFLVVDVCSFLCTELTARLLQA